jgi:hypothetical protein
MAKSEKRRLTPDDVEGFFLAAEKRPKPPALNKKLALQDILFRKNPWRWMRLKGDIKWMRRVLEKEGLDPEEFRWLL